MRVKKLEYGQTVFNRAYMLRAYGSTGYAVDTPPVPLYYFE
jgi:hypothetical protein